MSAGWYCFLAYMFNLLPYLGVTRQAFIYHYMPALSYAMFVTGILLQLTVPQWALDKYVVPVWLTVVIAAYVYWAAWVYALPLTPEAHNSRRWLSTWT
jgi:dolichyl-phosphate-mannose-protein mannosyltransferase